MAAFLEGYVLLLEHFAVARSYGAAVAKENVEALVLGQDSRCGVIAVFAILIHKELLLPILCALFYIEDLSVIVQVAYFKRTGGGRIFKMTPLHHHYQKPGDGTIKALIQRPYACRQAGAHAVEAVVEVGAVAGGRHKEYGDEEENHPSAGLAATRTASKANTKSSARWESRSSWR